MRFLTGILNSKLVAYWLKKKGKMQGDNYQVDKEPLVKIPLPDPTTPQGEIIELVDCLIACKTEDESADVSNIENSIDKLTYEIYGLTSREIEIIEQL